MTRLVARKSLYLGLAVAQLGFAVHAQAAEDSQTTQGSGPNTNWADAYAAAQASSQQNMEGGAVDPSGTSVAAKPASKEPALPRSKWVQDLLDDGVNLRASLVNQYAQNTPGGVY